MSNDNLSFLQRQLSSLRAKAEKLLSLMDEESEDDVEEYGILEQDIDRLETQIGDIKNARR
jgi:hypothetical protein